MRILLAFDGSEPGKRAAARAAEVARRLGASLTILIVGELIESGYGALVPVANPEAYEEALSAAVEEARAAGANADGKLAWGQPPDQIVAVARDEGCEMIVMGHRGHGALHDLLLGSVAKHVIDHAPCSVMVVR